MWPQKNEYNAKESYHYTAYKSRNPRLNDLKAYRGLLSHVKTFASLIINGRRYTHFLKR